MAGWIRALDCDKIKDNKQTHNLGGRRFISSCSFRDLGMEAYFVAFVPVERGILWTLCATEVVDLLSGTPPAI